MEEFPDWMRIVRLTRFELEIAGARLVSTLSPAQRRKRAKLWRERDLRVQLGSGPNPVAGWINIDASPRADLRADLRRGLPLADGSVACIYTEHFLDHLNYPYDIRRLLRECHRVLKPSGVMRAVVHDAAIMYRAYVEGNVTFFEQLRAANVNSADTPAEFINWISRFDGFHQFMYDFETLSREFTRAGFLTVTRSAFGQASAAEINLDLDLPDREIQSLYLEAVK